MSIEIYLDKRERYLIPLLPDAKLETLDLGDIQYRKNDEIILIIERKTLRDLSASIMDGRSREQKARLLNCGFPRDRILYIIEGDLPKDLSQNVGSVPGNTLVGSMINTMFRDGLMVYRTLGISETVSFINKVHSKLKSDEVDYWQYESIGPAKYSATLKKDKKSNLTPYVCFISQLSMIPRVSEVTATAVAEQYKTMINLVKEYDKTPSHLRPKLLEDLTFKRPNIEKTQRIGPKLSERIYKYICGIEDTIE